MASEHATTALIKTPPALVGLGVGQVRAEVAHAKQPEVVEEMQPGRQRLEPLSERYLFLLVRRSALSFPVYDALSVGGPLPAEAPALPGGLSQA